MSSIMDWFTLAATLGGAFFGAGIGWGVAAGERRAARQRIDAMQAHIERLEARLDGLYNGRSNSKH